MNSLKTQTSGTTAAFFDIQTEEDIIIKGFRIINGSNGLFISVPDKKDKNGFYRDKVKLPKDLKDQLEKMAIEEFDKNK